MYLKALFDLSTSMIFFFTLPEANHSEGKEEMAFILLLSTQKKKKKKSSLPISVLFFGFPWHHTPSVPLLDKWLFLRNLCLLVCLCWHWAPFIPSSPRSRKFIHAVASVIRSGKQSKCSGVKQQPCYYAHIFYVLGSWKRHKEEGLLSVGMICRLGTTCSLRARIGWQFDHSCVWTRRPRPVTASCLPQGMLASGCWYFYLVAQSIESEQTELHCLFLSSLRSHIHNLLSMLLITSKSQACQYFRRDIAPLLDGCIVKIKTEKSLWDCCCHLEKWNLTSFDQCSELQASIFTLLLNISIGVQ